MKLNDKLIDLIKWFISSVCLVIITLIVDTGFRERESGIKEMEVYDKYVDIILQADNIEQRWKLCEYFSIVTPTERLRDRWKAYKDTISKDYYSRRLSLDSSTNIFNIVDLNDKPLISSEKNFETNSAMLHELNGFSYLLIKDFDNSLLSFQNAEKMKPSLHNCWEIINYMINNKIKLKDPDSEEWNIFYKKILKDWSWGLPDDIKKELNSKVN